MTVRVFLEVKGEHSRRYGALAPAGLDEQSMDSRLLWAMFRHYPADWQTTSIDP